MGPWHAKCAGEYPIRMEAARRHGTRNIGECFAFGRIAARNAVAELPWDQKSSRTRAA